MNKKTGIIIIFLHLIAKTKQLLELTWTTEDSKNYIYTGIGKGKTSQSHLLLTLTNSGVSLHCSSTQSEMYDLDRSTSKIMAECDFSKNCNCTKKQCDSSTGTVYREILKFKQGPRQGMYEFAINCEKKNTPELSPSLGYNYQNYSDVDGYFGLGYPEKSKKNFKKFRFSF